MSLVAGLKRLLESDVVVRAAERGSIELRETRPDSKMRVKIVGLPAVHVAIQIERVGHPSHIRKGLWKRICDYLLVVESDDRTHVVFIELKKTQTNKEKAREQLRRSRPLLEYFRSVCEIESGASLRDEVSLHYSILFERTSPRLAKQSVRTNPTTEEPKRYKDIMIRTFVGKRVPLPVLTKRKFQRPFVLNP